MVDKRSRLVKASPRKNDKGLDDNDSAADDTFAVKRRLYSTEAISNLTEKVAKVKRYLAYDTQEGVWIPACFELLPLGELEELINKYVDQFDESPQDIADSIIILEETSLKAVVSRSTVII